MVRELQAAGLAVARSPQQGVARQGMHLAQDGCEKPEILKGFHVYPLAQGFTASRLLTFWAR